MAANDYLLSFAVICYHKSSKKAARNEENRDKTNTPKKPNHNIEHFCHDAE